MLLKGAAIQRQLAKPDPATRLFVLGGPDESGSRALANLVGASLGSGAERIDIAPSTAKDDPAILADEAAAIGLFGEPRWILVSLSQGGGDDVVAAANALLGAPAAGNPVVVVGGGITAKSRLAKLAETHPQAVLVISYLPDAGNVLRLAEELAAPFGLTLERGVAKAIADACGNDRGVMAREIEKLAIFLDADAGRPASASMDAWLAIGANLTEEDVGEAVNIILDGRTAELPTLFATLEATGSGDIGLVRALGMRAQLLARLRSAVERGDSPAHVVETQGKSIFWKEKANVTRQLSRWNAAKLGRLVERLHSLERAMKAPDNAGSLVLRAALLDIARVAASNR